MVCLFFLPACDTVRPPRLSPRNDKPMRSTEKLPSVQGKKLYFVAVGEFRKTSCKISSPTTVRNTVSTLTC